MFTTGNFEENLGSLPVHLGSVGMRVAEVRLDYMGSCILMGTISGFNSNMHDTWVLPDITAQPRPGENFCFSIVFFFSIATPQAFKTLLF